MVFFFVFLLYCTNEVGDAAFSLVFIEISFPIGNTPLIMGRCTKKEKVLSFFVARLPKLG